MTHSLAKWLEEWAAIVTRKPFLAAVLCQSLNSSSSAVLPCWCRAGSRAILKSLIILILDREQHGSTAYLMRINCIRHSHFAISIPAIYFMLVYICRLFLRFSRAAVLFRRKIFFLRDFWQHGSPICRAIGRAAVLWC